MENATKKVTVSIPIDLYDKVYWESKKRGMHVECAITNLIFNAVSQQEETD